MQNPMTVDPHFTVRGAAPTFEPFRGEFTRFVERFSDDQLAIVWKFGGLGFDPETQEVAPYPGRETFVKFIRPIPGSFRDILRRAVRTAIHRKDWAALAVLLRTLVVRPVGIQLPAPVSLDTPQWRCHPPVPARAP